MDADYKKSNLFRTAVGKMILARLQAEMEAADNDDEKMDEVVKKFYAANGWLKEQIN